MKNETKKITYSGMFLALALLLPFLTFQNQALGNTLCLIHIPILLCGFVCGPRYALEIGFIAPILRFMLFTKPSIDNALVMAFELAAYGLIVGLLYKKLPKKIPYIYVSLIGAMVGGRIVWGIAKFFMLGFSTTAFPMSMFIAGAVTNAVPGIILQIVLIPIILLTLQKLKALPKE